MNRYEPTAHQRRNSRRLRSATLSAFASFGVLFAITAPGILPAWGETTTLVGSSATPGALDLQVGGEPDTGMDRADLDFALNDLAPGDSKAILVMLVNTGTLAFTYSATAKATTTGSGGVLSRALRFSVVVGGTVTGGSRTGSCTGGETQFGPSTLPASETPIISVTPTSSPLLPGQTQSICVVVTLPANTGNSAQGDSAEAKVLFQATQAM